MSTLPVVAAVDGSDESLRALEWAVDAARRRAAPLRVAHVRQYAHWAQQSHVLAALHADPQDDPVLGRVRAHLEGRADQPDTEYAGLEGAAGTVLPGLGATSQLLVPVPGAAAASPVCCSAPPAWPPHATPSAPSSWCRDPDAR